MKSVLRAAFRPSAAAFALCAGLAASFVLGGCSGANETSEKPLAEAQTPEPAVETPPDSVLCTVNGEAITAGEVEKRLDEQLASMYGGLKAIPPQQLDMLRSQHRPQTLDNLVTDRLLKQAAKDVEVTSADVDEALSTLQASLPPDVDFDEQLALGGLTLEGLRDTLRENLGVKKLLDARFEGLAAPEEAEIEAYYAQNEKNYELPETVEARHILIKLEDGDSEEARATKKAEAEGLRHQLVDEGADFGALALEHSDCPSKASGGNLGRFGRGDMVAPFDEAAFTLETGVVSEVVETRFGYHVIEVLDHRQAGLLPLEEARESISASLLDEKRRAEFEAYVEELKTQGEVEYSKGAEGAG